MDNRTHKPNSDSDNNRGPEVSSVSDMTNELFQRFRNGDDQAFDTIYLHWYEPVFNFLRAFTRSDYDAEDLTQDIFAKVWKKRDFIDSQKNGKAFMFSIARHAAVDFHRKKLAARNYLSNSDFTDNEVSSDEMTIAKEIELITEYAIYNMPAKRREVYLLSYRDGLSIPEISDRLGIPDKNVRNHLYQARKYLKDILALVLLLIFP